MANFSTHFGVAASVSAMVSTAYLRAGSISTEEALIIAIAGIIGGILPDIDSDHSRPLQIIFLCLYIIIAFFFIHLAPYLSILEIWMMLAGSYILFRHVLLALFKKWTIHRGIFHSILAALFFWFFTTALASHLFLSTDRLAWMCGFLVFVGFLVHLLLDEFYSVDFNGKRLKRSFGTAFKLINSKRMGNTLIFVALTLIALQWTPSAEPFQHIVLNMQTYENMRQSFMPGQGWLFWGMRP